jgi:hypothetical protein
MGLMGKKKEAELAVGEGLLTVRLYPARRLHSIF